MRAILIDSVTKTVREVDFARSDNVLESLRSLYDLLSPEGTARVSHVEVMGLQNGDLVYVDAEPFLKECTCSFALEYWGTMAGCGVVLGVDDEGDTCEPKSTVEEVRELVVFPESLPWPLTTYSGH